MTDLIQDIPTSTSSTFGKAEPTNRRWGKAARVYHCKTLVWYDHVLKAGSPLLEIVLQHAYVESSKTTDNLRPFTVRRDAVLVCRAPRKTEGITFEEADSRYPNERPYFLIMFRGQIVGYAEPAD